MYLWFSIYVDNYYQILKEKVEKVKEEIGLRYETNNLPWHISLKISFEAPKDKESEIIKDVEAFYTTLKPFTLSPKSIEKNHNILWIRYQDNDYLTLIQKELNQLLNEKYHIPYHPYDIDFIFHTTLYMNDNENLISLGYEKLKCEELPKEIYLNKFLIGNSPLGIPETYQVIKEISVE